MELQFRDEEAIAEFGAGNSPLNPGPGGGRAARHWHPAIDFALVALLFIADWYGVIPFTKTPFLLALGWVSLRLRGIPWRELGLTYYVSLPRTLGLGFAGGILVAGFQLLVVQSFVAWVSGAQPDLSDFQELKGNLVLLLLLVTLSWLVAAFGEEMVYRGYLMNRAAEWGGNGRRAWWLSAFLVSVLFGVAHASQGPSGMVVEGVAGFWLALAYLGTGRNLLVPIIIHGVQNTVDFGLIYHFM